MIRHPNPPELPDNFSDRVQKNGVSQEFMREFDIEPADLTDAVDWIEENYEAVATANQTQYGHEIVAIPKFSADPDEIARALQHSIHEIEGNENCRDDETGIRSGKGGGFFSRNFL